MRIGGFENRRSVHAGPAKLTSTVSVQSAIPNLQSSALRLDDNLMIQHPCSADLFGPQPDSFSDKLLALWEDVRLGITSSAQIEDVAALPATFWGEQHAVKTDDLIILIGKLL